LKPNVVFKVSIYNWLLCPLKTCNLENQMLCPCPCLDMLTENSGLQMPNQYKNGNNERV